MVYMALARELRAVTDGVPCRLANLANGVAVLWQRLEDINWAGFYRLEGETLALGPFQGKPACIFIPLGKGVCGTAAQAGRTVRVEDVHAFPGHIACDSASNSEIVLPLYRGGALWGVLDIDSPTPGRFTPEDEAGLELVRSALEEMLACTEEGAV